MSLPPDPHDDDLADPSPPAPPPPPSPPGASDDAPASAGGPGWSAAAGSMATAPPPPPPPPAPAPATGDPTPPPTSPSYPPVDPTAQAPPLSGGAAEPGDAGRGVRGRLGLMLAGVVAIIAVAGTVVVLTGDDDSDAPPSAEDDGTGESADAPTGEEGPPTGSGPDDPGASTGTVPTPADEAATPVEVAESFFAAVEEGDCQGIIDHMTVESFSTEGQTADEAVAECEADEAGLAAITAADSWAVEPLTEQGDQATVSVTLVVDGDESVRELPLERVDGVWKMDLDPTAAAPAG